MIAFTLAIISIILYILVESPMYSLVTVLCILIFAMYPTFRKSYNKPQEETLSLYIIAAIRSGISIVATFNISLLTIGLPVFVIIANVLFISMTIIRKNQLKL